MITNCRRFAFAALGPGPLDALDGVMGDGVFFAEIFEQRRQRREAMPNRGARRVPVFGGAADFAALEVFAPFDDVRAGDDPEFLGPGDAGEAHEIPDSVPVGALRAGIFEIAKPLDLRRDVREALKLGGGQQPLGRGDRGRQCRVSHDRLAPS